MAYSYYRNRDEFISRMTHEGFSLDTIRALLRLGTTIQRLAVAQCNGDWPADNGQRDTVACPNCERHWDPSTLKKHSAIGPDKYCEDCRAETRLPALLEGSGWVALTGGDPRGCTLKLFPATTTPEQRYQSWGDYICVPARER